AGGHRPAGDRPAAGAAGGGRDLCAVRPGHGAVAAHAALGAGGVNTGASAWSPQQRRWLQALGYSVLRLGGGDDAVEAVAEQAPEVAPESVPARVHSPVDGYRHDRDVAPVRRAPPPPVTPAAPEQDSAPAAPVRGAL